jgi:hypothetical protein
MIQMARRELSIDEMFKSVLYIVVGVALVPVLYSIITTANITDAITASVISLIPLFFVISLVYATVKGMM